MLCINILLLLLSLTLDFIRSGLSKFVRYLKLKVIHLSVLLKKYVHGNSLYINNIMYEYTEYFSDNKNVFAISTFVICTYFLLI